VEKDLEHRKESDPFRDQELNQTEQLLRQHDETECREADEKGGEELREDVPIQDCTHPYLGHRPSVGVDNNNGFSRTCKRDEGSVQRSAGRSDRRTRPSDGARKS